MAPGTLHELKDPTLANTSFVLELGGGAAVVIDPPRDVSPHLALASDQGLDVVASIETHLHSDFVSGSRELAARAGAEVIAPAAASLCFSHRGVRDGDLLEWGDVRLEVLETPGHVPEHVSYVLRRPHEPAVVFTGGSLILGGAGRTDLIDASATDKLSRAQFASLQRLAALPASTIVQPTHGAGSFCLAGPSITGTRTIGEERATNRLLQVSDEDRFVDAIAEGFGTYPHYFRHLREVNRTGPALVSDLREPSAIDPRDVGGNAWIVDARPIAEWASGHPVGAISNELRPVFPSWLGWAIPFDSDVVLLVDEPQAQEAVRLCRAIGYDRVIGWIEGGISAWEKSGLPVARVDAIDPVEAHRRTGNGSLLLDVRQQAEFASSRIPGADHLELGAIIDGGYRPNGVPEVIVFCGHGERSATAASFLERHGVCATNLVGGIGAWQDAGLPVDDGPVTAHA